MNTLNLKSVLLIAILFPPALILGMQQETKSAHAERAWTAGELVEFKRQQDAKNAGDAKTSLETKATASATAGQDTIDPKFVELLTRFNKLPEDLQQKIYSFDKPLEKLHVFPDHGDIKWIYGLAVYQDAGTFKAISGCGDGMVKVWNLTSGALLFPPFQFGSAADVIETYQDSTGWKAVVGGLDSKNIMVLNLATGKIVHDFEAHMHRGITNIKVYQDHTGWKAISNGKDCRVHIWDLARGERVHTLTENNTENVLEIYQDKIGWKAITIACNVSLDHHGVICLWDLSTYEQIATLSGHTSRAITTVTPYDDNGHMKLLSACDDRTIRVWDLATHTCLHILQGHTEFIYAPPYASQWEIVLYRDTSGWNAISAVYGNNMLIAWDLTTGKQINTFYGPAGKTLNHLEIRQEGKNLKAYCVWGNTLHIRDLSTSKEQTLQFNMGNTLAFKYFKDNDEIKFIVSGTHLNTFELWGQRSLTETLNTETLNVSKASKIIEKLNQNCGGKTGEILRKIIQDYAIENATIPEKEIAQEKIITPVLEPVTAVAAQQPAAEQQIDAPALEEQPTSVVKSKPWCTRVACAIL